MNMHVQVVYASMDEHTPFHRHRNFDSLICTHTDLRAAKAQLRYIMSNFSNNTFCRTSSCQINQFEHHPHSASDREAFSTQEYSEVYAILLGRESFGTKFVSFSFFF